MAETAHAAVIDLGTMGSATLYRVARAGAGVIGLDVVRPRPGSGPVHLPVDGTGLRLCGSGEWLLKKHGTKTQRSWRKLHIAVDADTGLDELGWSYPVRKGLTVREAAHSQFTSGVTI